MAEPKGGKDFYEYLAKLITKLNQANLAKKKGKGKKTYSRKNVTPSDKNNIKLKSKKNYIRKGGALVKKDTPKTDTPRVQAAKEKLNLAKRGVNKDTAFNRKYKVKGSATNPYVTDKKGRIKPNKNKVKTSKPNNTGRPMLKIEPKKTIKRIKNVASNVKNSNVVKHLKKIRNAKVVGTATNILGKGLGVVGGAGLVYEAADNAAGAIRTGGNIYRRIKGKPLLESLGGMGKAEGRLRIKEKNAYLKEHGSLKGFNKYVAEQLRTNKKTKKTNKTNKNNKTSVNQPISETNNSTTQKVSKVNNNKNNDSTSSAQSKREKRRRKAISRAYGKISESRMKKYLNSAVTQRELEES